MQKLFSKLSLNILLFSLVAIVAITSTALVQWRNYTASYENEIKRVEQKHLLVAQNLSLALDRYLQDLSSISTHLWNSYLTDPATVGLFKNFNMLAAGAIYDEQIDLYDQSTLDSEQLGSSETFQAFVASTGEAIKVSGLLRVGDVLAFGLAKRDGDRVFFSLLPLDYIRAIQHSIQFGDRGHSAIVDQTGKVLAHPNKTLEAKGADLIKVSIVQEMVAGGTGVSFFYSPPMAADMIAGFTTMERSGWGIMVPQPLMEIEQGVLDDIRSGTFVAFGVLVVFLIIAYMIAQRLTGSLVQNVENLRLMSEGKAIRLSPGGDFSKESATLSQTMQATAKQIKESQDNLAQSLAIARSNVEKQNEFIDVMNHNIRTPLNGIAGVGGLLDEEAEAEELAEYREIILKGVNDIVTILEQRFDSTGMVKQDDASIDQRPNSQN